MSFVLVEKDTQIGIEQQSQVNQTIEERNSERITVEISDTNKKKNTDLGVKDIGSRRKEGQIKRTNLCDLGGTKVHPY